MSIALGEKKQVFREESKQLDIDENWGLEGESRIWIYRCHLEEDQANRAVKSEFCRRGEAGESFMIGDNILPKTSWDCDNIFFATTVGRTNMLPVNLVYDPRLTQVCVIKKKL